MCNGWATAQLHKRGGEVFTSVLHESQLSAACGILGAPLEGNAVPHLCALSPLARLISGRERHP